jgi:tetratricopeptide (TPR) repeat protein
MPTEDATGRQPIPPATRRRLQQLFEHGSRNMAQGNHDYATEMFTQCVVGDPTNMIYLQNFSGNLQKKYNNNKKGGKLASLKGAGARSSIKKAAGKEDWPALFKAACDMLKLNPWDATALTAMAAAYERLECDECQLFCLRTALDAAPMDVAINRLSGKALARMGQFDQAIACWRRVEQAKPGDEEANRMMGDLTVEKTIHQGHYEDKLAQDEVGGAGPGAAAGKSAAPSREQVLKQAIQAKPENLSGYLDLGDWYTKQDRYDEAIATLKAGLDASGGGDLNIRERLEDVQLQAGRRQVEVAEQRAEKEKTPEAEKLVKRMRAEQNHREIQVFAARVERSPGNAGLKYELGVRLKRAGKFKEAIQSLQGARGDNRHKGAVHVELGDCFHHVDQDKLALSNYQTAIEETPERDAETKKRALYRAGILAIRLKEWDAAEMHLTELAGLDFGYKDVAKWLDKLGEIRNKE